MSSSVSACACVHWRGLIPLPEMAGLRHNALKTVVALSVQGGGRVAAPASDACRIVAAPRAHERQSGGGGTAGRRRRGGGSSVSESCGGQGDAWGDGWAAAPRRASETEE